MTTAAGIPRRNVSRGTYIRRWIVLSLIALIAACVGIYLPATLLLPLASAHASPVSYQDPHREAAALAWPSYGASAIGVTGYPAASQASGSTTALPMASISKIITSLVVLEVKPLQPGEAGPTVTFTAADAGLLAKYVAQNGEVKPMAAGSTLSQLDLMKITLVASANNYADALAVWAYGSETKFIEAARAWLDSHGLDQTTFVEPTGISPQNASTPTELVKLGQLAMTNPVIAGIVGTSSMSLPAVGAFKNTNLLLGSDGVEGIKTGTLNGKSNLLFAAEYTFGKQTVMVVGAIIGAPNRSTLNQSVAALLQSAQSSFHEVRVVIKGEPFASYATPWAATSTAIAARDASVLVWGDTPVAARVVASPVAIESPAAIVGAVTITAGLQSVKVPLVLGRILKAPSALWRITNPFPSEPMASTPMSASRHAAYSSSGINAQLSQAFPLVYKTVSGAPARYPG